MLLLSSPESAASPWVGKEAADPDNIMRQPDIEVDMQKIGAIRLAAGDYDGALAAYEECLAIARRMVEALPDRAVWQQDISSNLDKVGQAAPGRYGRALRLCDPPHRAA